MQWSSTKVPEAQKLQMLCCVAIQQLTLAVCGRGRGHAGGGCAHWTPLAAAVCCIASLPLPPGAGRNLARAFQEEALCDHCSTTAEEAVHMGRPSRETLLAASVSDTHVLHIFPVDVLAR